MSNGKNLSNKDKVQKQKQKGVLHAKVFDNTFSVSDEAFALLILDNYMYKMIICIGNKMIEKQTLQYINLEVDKHKKDLWGWT